MEVGGGLSVHTWITSLLANIVTNIRLSVLTHREQSSPASDGDQSVSEI